MRPPHPTPLHLYTFIDPLLLGPVHTPRRDAVTANVVIATTLKVTCDGADVADAVSLFAADLNINGGAAASMLSFPAQIAVARSATAILARHSCPGDAPSVCPQCLPPLPIALSALTSQNGSCCHKTFSTFLKYQK